MKIPGLDSILEDLKDLPDATARIEGSLSTIENLLGALVDIELARESKALRAYIEEKFGVVADEHK